MTRKDTLLELACERIHSLGQPACIKNSELVHVEVNAAYARLFGQSPDRFSGAHSSLFDETYTGSDREIAERRCIVFGEDTISAFETAQPSPGYDVHAEQFVTENGDIYLYEYFQSKEPPRVAVAANDASHAVAERRNPEPGEPLLQIIRAAVDEIEVALFILDSDDRVIFVNKAFRDFAKYDHFPIEGGIRIRDALYRMAKRQAEDEGKQTSEEQIESWVEKRITDLKKPHSESIVHLKGERYIRVINHRMPNGFMVGVRIDVSDAAKREAIMEKQFDELSLFKAVLDRVPVANFARNENHKMIYVNEAYAKIVGKPAAELIGTDLEDLFGDDADTYRKANEEIARNGGIWTGEQSIPSAQGGSIDVVTKLMWLTLESGQRILTGSMTDVSVIKKREAELKKRETELEAARARGAAIERKLQTVMDSVGFGVLVINQQDLTIEMANTAIYDNWNKEEMGSLEGHPFTDLLDYNFRAGNYDFGSVEFEAYKESWLNDIKRTVEMPERLIDTDRGKHFIVNGKPIGENRFMVTYNDVSELRHHEQEISSARVKLAETGLLMNEAMASMQQGFVITDPKMRILVGNEAARKMLDLTDGMIDPGSIWTDMMKYCLEKGYFTETMDELNTRWKESRAAGVPMQMVACVNDLRWVRLEVKASPDDLRVITMTDITEERERQKNLEMLVSRAETADRAKSEFLANMSHEIRTPMNGILGMAELLAKSELDSKQKTFTDIIVKSGNALLTIINDILDFSKIDAGQMKLREGVFDPLEAVEDVATLLSAAAAEKDVELVIKSSPELPASIHGDAGRFRQIVTNLVGNSVKFTEKGHILITLSVRDVDGKPSLQLDVSDTGIGIPENKLSDIFEKFSQVDGSSTRRHEGTGLGLAITAGLVNLFGGTIDVTSKLGSGTTFSASLPMRPASSQPARKIITENQGARILVIDDNEINRTILMEQLNTWGYDACAAEDGPQGLAVLDAAHSLHLPVDLVILDYHMPGMNGVEVARAIRAKSVFENTPIMFLTSMDMASDERRFADMNVQAHLMKPARSQLLKTTIAELLGTQEKQGMKRQKAIADTAAEGSASPGITGTPAAPAAAATDSKFDLLIAEDNEVNQIVFSQILQQTRYQFHIAHNGLQAVEFWKEHHPPVILMDVSMPVMNGHEATRKIRALEQEAGLPRTPIIGVTAHAQESDKELCFAAGMDDYMSKPISPERLQDKLLRWMPSSQKRKQA